MSVDEAARTYGLVKEKYVVLRNNQTLEKADVAIYYSGYDLARYAPRTSQATQPAYNKDIYAVGFQLRDSTLSLNQVIAKLETDFKKKFVETKTKYDSVYYELKATDCETILVYAGPDWMYADKTYAIRIAFTYKLNPDEITRFMESSGDIRSD